MLPYSRSGTTATRPIDTFANKYAGQDIEFDGSVAALTGHADPNDIRHDNLIAPGDNGANSAASPSFQFQNVSDKDLHLTGSNPPASLTVGDKLQVVAEVGEFNSTNCLFQLTPVSTALR